MVKLEKVNKYFNRRKNSQIHIINNTSLELENAGLVAILGNSGSGKTTLLNAIGGLDKVNSGKIYINGKKITRRRASTVDKIRGLNIGYIFQDYKLMEDMSVYDNVAISLKMIGVKNKQEIQRRVNYVLEAVNMYRYRNRHAGMLSGGEKQRVAIARAIVKNPSIVIADEPTGNLDSKNSLEIMNIIKALSKNRLVILVTHEVELANFYASRIIKIQDGKVVEDYKNEPKESLEYRLDNKIYLRDFQNIDVLNKNNVNLNVYMDNDNKDTNIKLVIKDGNIYIESENKKIEIIDENSATELVDENYKKIDKSIYDNYEYNLSKVIDRRYKPKYTSILRPFMPIINGFKQVYNYKIIKKILLLGFFIASMFIVYSLSNIAGVIEVKDNDFMKIDKNYLQADLGQVAVNDFLKYEKSKNVEYILPGNTDAIFVIKMEDYYQLIRFTFKLSGSLVDLGTLTANDLIKGRMPKNNYEIVIDKKVAQKMINASQGIIAALGIKSENDLLNKKIFVNNMKDFRIVGIVDKNARSIYVKKSMFINILNNAIDPSDSSIMFFRKYEGKGSNGVLDYNLLLDDIKLTKGRFPKKDYEVILNSMNEDDIELNEKIKMKVNNKKLKVVGFYDSKTNMQSYLVNNNTVKYDIIRKSNGLMIYSKDKKKTIEEFKKDYKIDLIDRYEEDKKIYLKQREGYIKNSIIFSAIVFLISLVEIYLIIRSSFLSRIKEIGIYRAIGIKKNDIYRMFFGEILALTTISSLPRYNSYGIYA